MNQAYYLLLYLDDLFLTGNEKHIKDCRKNLAEEFEIKDLGLMHYFLRMELWEILKEILLNQGKYAIEILKIFDMLDCKSMDTPTDTNMKLLRISGCDLVQTYYWVVNVSDEY